MIPMKIPCPECSGEGEDAGDCNGCGGWGAYEGEPCGRCEGSGDCPACDGRRETGLSWVIIGGESGPGHRTLDLVAADALADWERDVRFAMPSELYPRLRKAHLDAPDAVLDARIIARGTPVSSLDRAMRERHRAEAADDSESECFDTSRDSADVASALLAWAMEAIR